MADDMVIAKISRFDPSVDAEARFETYEVPWKEFLTGLEVLHYVNENIEPIDFDYCCRSSLCGRCSMLIDGTPKLACWVSLEPGEHTFEPLPGFPVIKDLVIDHSHIMTKMVETGLAVKTVEPITELPNIPYDLYWNTLEKLNMCRECMCCYAACPVLQKDNKWDSFIGPAAMAQIALRFLDPKDQGDRATQAAFAGIFDCTLCGECMKVCPAKIPHVTVFQELQKAAEEKGLKPAA